MVQGQNRSALEWVIRDYNGIIKVVVNRHMNNVSIIIAECKDSIDGVLVSKNNEFLNLEIEGDSKVVLNSYNKKSNVPSYIMLLIEDIWKIT